MQQETETGNSKTALYDCIICAAGGSSRMGEWKPLLPWGKTTLVEASVDAALAGGCRIILVTGLHAEKLEDVFRGRKNLVTVRNGGWEKGMISSIRCGAALVTSEYFFVTHADMPLVPSLVYGELVAAARRSVVSTTDKIRVLRPRFAGIPGHPVLFERGALPLIAALPDGESMKGFLGRCDLEFIDTDKRGVTLDLDDPEIYSVELASFDLERATQGILVLTGEKGTGKTTRIGRAFDCASSRKLSAVLVRQTETGRSPDGRATGFDMEMSALFENGEPESLTMPLARLESDSFDPPSRTTVGPYVFDRSAFARALRFVGSFIERTEGQVRFFGLDEIGRLELERSDGLMQVFRTIIAAVRKARAAGLAQQLVCTARLGTLDKLEACLVGAELTADVQTLHSRQTGATKTT